MKILTSLLLSIAVLCGPFAGAAVTARNGVAITTGSTINGKTPNSAVNGQTIGSVSLTELFVADPVAGGARTDFTGCVGVEFTAAANFTVYELARWVVSGNSQTHTVTLLNATGTVLGSVSVNTSGAPAGAFKYVALGSPVALTNGNVYHIHSSEVASSDVFLDSVGTTLTPTAVANTIRSSFDADCTGTPTFGGQVNTGFGPTNLKYSL
jgi:hypothetical protein